MARRYSLDRRAKTQAATRARIVEAAIALHQDRGIAATSMRDVAARAGVAPVTVYRHFADEAALTGACGAAYFERHPLPDPARWRAIDGAQVRLRAGLRETYRYHRETAPMIARVLGEARDLPVMAPYHAHWQRAGAVLLEAFPVAEQDDARLRAAIALALGFETWQVLTQDDGLSDAEAADLMARLPGCRGGD